MAPSYVYLVINHIALPQNSDSFLLPKDNIGLRKVEIGFVNIFISI